MENITLSAPASFSIPKKKRKEDVTRPPARASPPPLQQPESQPIWQDIHLNSPQFAKLHETLHNNCFDPNFRLGIHGAKLLNNPWLHYRYMNYRKRLEADGQPDKEDIAFLQISMSPGELAHIAEHGVPVGTSLNDHLGESENGVYLSTNVDLVGPQSFMISARAPYVIRVVICKILKGKVYMVEPGSKNLKPTFGYGCHMAKATGNDSNKRDLPELYRQQLVYVYEINEQVGEIVPSGVNVFGIKELETELAPSGILPYACVDVAVDFETLTKKKLRIPRFELKSPPFYTGRIFVMGEMYAVNFRTIKDGSWKPFGIAPTLFVENFVKWKRALEKSPLLDLSQNEFGAMLYNKEIQLPNGLFVTYAVLTSLAISLQFTTLIETLTTNQLIGFCASTENVQSYLIPPGELANHLGLPSHVESAFHLIVVQPRSFFGLHLETIDQRLLTRRQTLPDEKVEGFNDQLKDYTDEEFRQNINSSSGTNARYRLQRILSRNTQENPQNDNEREMPNEDQKGSMIAMDDERTEYDGPDEESEMRTEDAQMVTKERSPMRAADGSKIESLDEREPETSRKSEKNDQTQRLNDLEQLDEKHRETHEDVSMDISVDAESLGDRIVSMNLRERLSQHAVNPTRFIVERGDRSHEPDRLTGRERKIREKEMPTSSRDRSSEHNLSTRRKHDWVERSNKRERERHDKGRREDSRERWNERERGRKHNKDRKRRRSRESVKWLSSDRSTSVTSRNGHIDRSKERDRETRTDALKRDRDSSDVEDLSDRSSTNAKRAIVKERESGRDERAKSVNECAMSTERDRKTDQRSLTAVEPREVMDLAAEPDFHPLPRKTFKPLKPPARSSWRKKKNV